MEPLSLASLLACIHNALALSVRPSLNQSPDGQRGDGFEAPTNEESRLHPRDPTKIQLLGDEAPEALLERWDHEQVISDHPNHD